MKVMGGWGVCACESGGDVVNVYRLCLFVYGRLLCRGRMCAALDIQ